MQKSKVEKYKKEKKFYSPQLSAVASEAIRRLSWSLNKPMTKAIEQVIFALPAIIDPMKICITCRERQNCNVCIFDRKLTEEEKKAILTFI